ncbi:MAG TPA: hypothetical protein DF774_09400 [Rheinheimera sp.]|uniref:hypothetical protein n=1 Tax=Rheinheimera sp. TaxID=1869214 RepID=UPI000EDEF9FB|nr:hypothetical protein [Rheinheimera sp.]HCU65961.1 hypothetical protein [Rheinheimera sp.]
MSVVHRYTLPVLLSFFLTSCGYFSADPKQLAEQAWLAKDQQLAEAVSQIREQGLDAVVASAEAGSVAACVAGKLTTDPLGKLISVEGALAESAKVAQLLADLEQLLQQDFSFEQLASTLEKGAAAAAYAKTLIDQQGLEQALQTLKQMVSASSAVAQQDLGAHLQSLLQSCQTAAPAETTSTTSQKV